MNHSTVTEYLICLSLNGTRQMRTRTVVVSSDWTKKVINNLPQSVETKISICSRIYTFLFFIHRVITTEIKLETGMLFVHENPTRTRMDNIHRSTKSQWKSPNTSSGFKTLPLTGVHRDYKLNSMHGAHLCVSRKKKVLQEAPHI